MYLGPAWLPTVGSHARLWRTTLCDGGKARRTCGKKKLAQMNYCFCDEPHLTRKANNGRFSVANVSMAWRTKAGNHTAAWFLSLHSLFVRGFSFASYFISPSAHKQLFTEFEQDLVWIEEVRKF
jgi:hypothetical protein